MCGGAAVAVHLRRLIVAPDRTAELAVLGDARLEAHIDASPSTTPAYFPASMRQTLLATAPRVRTDRGLAVD